MLWSFLSLMLLVAFAPFTQAASIAGVDKQRYALGSAFDSDGSRFLSQGCVEADSKSVNNRRASFHVDYAKDFESMQKSIDRLASGGFDIGLFSASSTVEYFARVHSSKLRESLVLEFHAQDKSIYLAPDLRIKPSLIGVERTGQDKRELCGTEFVQQIDLGYRLFINVTLNFSDLDSFERYKKTTKVSALFGLISSTSTTINELKKFGSSVHLEVDALQEGGDKRFVQSVLNDDRQCAASDLERCLKIFTQLTCYMNATPQSPGDCDEAAGTDRPQSFTQVMRDASERSYLDPEGPSILRYVTESYEDAGIDELLDADDQALPAADQLKANSQRLAQALVRASSLQQRIQSSLDFDHSNDKDRLSQYQSRLASDVLLLQDALKTCQESRQALSCQSKTDAALAGLVAIDEALLFPGVAF